MPVVLHHVVCCCHHSRFVDDDRPLTLEPGRLIVTRLVLRPEESWVALVLSSAPQGFAVFRQQKSDMRRIPDFPQPLRAEWREQIGERRKALSQRLCGGGG